MPYSIEFQLGSLFFVLVLNIVYFKKEKVANAENKVYSFLLIFTPITLVLDIISVILIGNSQNIPPILVTLSAKIYCVSLAIWVTMWCRYVITIGFRQTHNSIELLLYQYIRNFFFKLNMVFVIIVAILPIYYTGTGRNVYSYGPATMVVYILAFSNWFFSILCLIFYFKRISLFHILPIFSYIVVQGVFGIIQFIFPNVLLTSFAGSVTVMILFFTVENPDIELIHALEEAQTKADEANKTKDRFLANMSHEIRTPLNAILGMNEMITRESTSPSINEYSEHINESGKILLSLINDILDFSKIEAGKMELIPLKYNLASALNNIENMMLSKIEAKGLNLDINVEPEVPKYLVGDEMRIKQILINILNNAFKYTEHGTITLRISIANPYMDKYSPEVELEQYLLPGEDKNGPYSFIKLHFEIEDTGMGIKKEHLDTLFDAFNRVMDKQSYSKEGTGLGLSITNGFLKLMNSNLNVNSEFGKGSVFYFNLIQRTYSSELLGDYKLRYKNKINSKHTTDTWYTKNVRILAVDDVRVNLAVVKSLLKKLKADVDTVLSGEAAIEKCKSTTYDIILMDHMMPQMDGVETFKKLQEMWNEKNEKPTPVIALTANAIVGVKEMFIQEGFSGYLSKPIDSSEMDKLIQQHLSPDKIIIIP